MQCLQKQSPLQYENVISKCEATSYTYEGQPFPGRPFTEYKNCNWHVLLLSFQAHCLKNGRYIYFIPFEIRRLNFD